MPRLRPDDLGAGGGVGRRYRCRRRIRCRVLLRVAARRGPDRGRRTWGARGLGIRAARWSAPQLNHLLRISDEVAAALAQRRPVVSLETSILGQGLPAPHNMRAALGCEAAIRDEGGVPATVAVLDGRLCVGLSHTGLERVAAASVKVSSRDLGTALAHGSVGATTVAATMRVAAVAGVCVLCPGGLRGGPPGRPGDEAAGPLAPRPSPV